MAAVLWRLQVPTTDARDRCVACRWMPRAAGGRTAASSGDPAPWLGGRDLALRQFLGNVFGALLDAVGQGLAVLL